MATMRADAVTAGSRVPRIGDKGLWFGDINVALAALAIGGAIVAGMGWNIGLVTLGAALVAVAVALVAPAVGLATVAFMGPLTPPLVLPPPGFNAILVAAVLLGCVYRLPIDRPRIRLSWTILVVVAFTLYVAVQQTPEMMTGYTGSLGYLVYSDFRELLTGVGAIVAAALVLRNRRPFPILAVGLVSASISGLLAVATFVNPAPGPPFSGLIARGEVDRAIGSFGNPNYFGTFEAIALVAALGLMRGTPSTRLRLMLLAISAGLASALVLSLSRGALVAAAVGLATLAFARGRARTAALIMVGLLVATVVVLPVFVQWRLSTSFGSLSGDALVAQAESDEGRLSALLAGPQLFLTSPVFGVGWGHYSTMSAQFAGPGRSFVAHNWYMSVLAEEGSVGVVLWGLLLVTLAAALKQRPTFPRSVGFAALGAYAAGSLFLEAPTSFQTSAFPIIVIVAALTSDWTRPAWEQPARNAVT